MISYKLFVAGKAMGIIMSNKKSIEFINDWQKRSAKQQKIFIVVLMSTLFLTILVGFFGFLWYQNDNYNRIIEHNMNYVQDNALREAHDVEQHMDDNVKVIKKFAKQYDYIETNYPDSTIEDRIRILWDNTMFDRVSYISTDGFLTSLLGNTSVKDRDYFKDAMQGGSGYLLLDKSRVTNEPALMFYAPVYHGNEITGVLLGLHERERIDNRLTYTFLNYTPKTYLLQADGMVIGSSNDRYLMENMFDILSEKEFRGEVDFDTLMEVIADDKKKTTAFTFLDEGRSSIGVVAQFKRGDMIILTVMPSSVTDKMIDAANRSGRLLMLYISIAFIVLIIVFAVFLIRQRKRTVSEMTIATDSLHAALAHDQKQSFIIESLSNTYSSIYFTDVESLTYERVVEENVGLIDAVTENGDWKEGYGFYIESFVDEKDREKMRSFLDLKSCAKQLEENESLSTEYQRSDKEWRRAVMIPAEVDETGTVKSVIFAVQKIDAEKRRELDTKKALEDAYEAAKLASHAKTTFLSNISHDIRTPMNGIVGMTAIAGSNLGNDEKVADCLKKINVASKHLLGIINEVLDMSKIETGKVDLNEEEFHLSDLFDELITINQPLIKEKKHHLTVKVEAIEHENVIGDSVRLQQVFTNLLTNAIKYTPEGGKIEIIVSEKSTNKENIGWYEVVFRDNGIGMSDEFQRSMFEPFSRAKDSRISGIQGTGLGMPIARNIIRMMNGDITVESKLNEGSTFTVSFALRLQNQEEVDYSQFVDLPVLVVDDDVTACETACVMLDSLSMKSDYVTSGKEAVDKVSEHHDNNDDYYAVIVDWQMPGMNGIETTRAIRKRVGNEVPIIVISAYDWSEIEAEAKAAGVNAFLSKPLFKSRLVNLFSDLAGGEAAVDDAQSDIREQRFEGRRILLAEDNELNSEIAVEILSMMGLEVDTAPNGKACLEKFTESPQGRYDLIFMDIQMPEMDGYQATSAIRVSEHPQAKTIPIIAMSANAFSTDVRNAISAGMNGHIAKPIDINTVIKVLSDILE